MDFGLLSMVATVIDFCAGAGERQAVRCRAPHPAAGPAARVGTGQWHWPVERCNTWVLENKRFALRYDRLGFIVQSLLQSACIFLVAGRLAREF